MVFLICMHWNKAIRYLEVQWVRETCLCPGMDILNAGRRAQLQKSPGVWAAFWLQSKLIAKGEDPAVYGAEIDVMEFFRKLGKDIVSHNVH